MSWSEFENKLREAGTSVEEIDGCSTEVFQACLQELGYSALQSAKLQTTWLRRRQQQQQQDLSRRNSFSLQQTSASPAAAPSTSFAAPGSERNSPRRRIPARLAMSEQSSEFRELASRATEFLSLSTRQQHSSFLILSAERVANEGLASRFDEHRQRLHGSHLPTTTLWRYVHMDDIERACHDGFSADWVRDGLCESGMVLFSATASGDAIPGASQLPLGGDHPPMAPPPGAKLFAVEVALGNTRVLDEEDAALLSLFTPEKCVASLREEGYDSIRIRRKSPRVPETFVVFHAAQTCPSCIVTFASPGSSGAGGWTSGEISGLPEVPGGVDRVDPTADVARLRPSTCSVHPGKICEFWCIDERRLVCSHCMFLNGYQAKNCVLIDEGAKIERQAVTNWVGRVGDFIRESGAVMVAFDAAIDGVEKEVEQDVRTLRGDIETMKSQLDDLSQRCESELRHRAATQVADLQRTLTNVVTTIKSAEDVAVMARDALAKDTAMDILAARQLSSEKWDAIKVPAYAHPTVQFQTAKVVEALEANCVVVDVTGTVELPAAIDINNLRDEPTS